MNGTEQSARSWLAGHPVAADALLAVAVLPVANAVPRDMTAGNPTSLSVTLTAAACAALIVRRRWPTPVWALTLGLASAVILALHGVTGVVLTNLVALYTLASRTDRARRALGYAAVSGVVLLITHAAATAVPWRSASTYAPLTWAVLAAVVGIAVRLHLSPLTAKTHVHRAMTKLAARDRAHLVVLAYQTGLVHPGTEASP